MKDRLSQPLFWEDIYRKRTWGKYLPNPTKYRGHYELDLIFKSMLQPDTSKRLLEIGAGRSMWLPYFAQNFGFDVFGIDYSKQGCMLAERNLKLAGVKGHIFCEDFTQADVRLKGYFDIITSFGVIEHFNNPLEIIKLTKNFLKADSHGLIITVVPNTAGRMMQIQKLLDRDVFNIHKVFSLKELSNYHKKNGMYVTLERYLQFIDFGVLNYQGLFKGRSHRWVLRGITGVNLPILYLQKALRLFPQSKKWCSSMVVIASRTP